MYSSYYEERELGWNDSAYHDSTKVVGTVEIEGVTIKVGRNADGSKYFNSCRNWWGTSDQALAEFHKTRALRDEAIAQERSAKSHTEACGEAVKSLGLDGIKIYVYNKDFVAIFSEKKGSKNFPTRRLTPEEVAAQVKEWETTETKQEKVAALRKAGKPIPKHLR